MWFFQVKTIFRDWRKSDPSACHVGKFQERRPERTTWGACTGEQSNACNRFCWHHIWLCLSNDWFCQGCKGSQHFSHKVMFSTITVAQDLNGRTNAADISPKIVHICEERSLLLAGIPLLPPISLSPDAIVSAPVNHDLCHLGGERGEREREASSVCAALTKSLGRQIVAWPLELSRLAVTFSFLSETTLIGILKWLETSKWLKFGMVWTELRFDLKLEMIWDFEIWNLKWFETWINLKCNSIWYMT